GWKRFSPIEGRPVAGAARIYADRSGRVWFAENAFGRGGGGGVSYYDGRTWRTFTTADGLASDIVVDILQDERGAMWFATSCTGVSRFDRVVPPTKSAPQGGAPDSNRPSGGK